MKVTPIALFIFSVSLTTFSATLAAENNKCHIVMPSGEKVDLSGLCQDPVPENTTINQQNNNNNNAESRVIYGQQETIPVPQTPKLKSLANKRRRQRELAQKKAFQEYYQYQKYLQYYREHSPN